MHFELQHTPYRKQQHTRVRLQLWWAMQWELQKAMQTVWVWAMRLATWLAMEWEPEIHQQRHTRSPPHMRHNGIHLGCE